MTKKFMEKWGSRFIDCLSVYLPAKFHALTLQHEIDRTMIFQFKDGEHQDAVAHVVSSLIRRHCRNREDLCFVCIPASTPESNKVRYEWFSENVAKRCWIDNGYPGVVITGDKSPRHEMLKGFTREFDNYELVCNAFKGKRVIIFDDVITSGTSALKFAAALEEIGATVIGGIFLGRTTTSPKKESA